MQLAFASRRINVLRLNNYRYLNSSLWRNARARQERHAESSWGFFWKQHCCFNLLNKSVFVFEILMCWISTQWVDTDVITTGYWCSHTHTTYRWYFVIEMRMKILMIGIINRNAFVRCRHNSAVRRWIATSSKTIENVVRSSELTTLSRLRKQHNDWDSSDEWPCLKFTHYFVLFCYCSYVGYR